MAYDASNGHVLDDITWPYCPLRATGGLAELAPNKRFSSLYMYICLVQATGTVVEYLNTSATEYLNPIFKRILVTGYSPTQIPKTFIFGL